MSATIIVGAEELEDDELDSCDELDGIGLVPDPTELDKEELLLTAFELLDPPPPLLPPHAVSARLTTNSGSIF